MVTFISLCLELLMYLKEISDSAPENLREDFLKIFSDLDVSAGVLNSTNAMLMMLLTRLSMMHKRTEASVVFIKSRQSEEGLMIKLREAEASLRDYFQPKI